MPGQAGHGRRWHPAQVQMGHPLQRLQRLHARPCDLAPGSLVGRPGMSPRGSATQRGWHLPAPICRIWAAQAFKPDDHVAAKKGECHEQRLHSALLHNRQPTNRNLMALAGQHGAEGSWIALCVAFLLHLPATQENFTMLSWQRGTSCRPPADKQAGGQQAEQAGCRLNCSSSS